MAALRCATVVCGGQYVAISGEGEKHLLLADNLDILVQVNQHQRHKEQIL